MGGDVAAGVKVGGFDEAEQVGGEAAEQVFFVAQLFAFFFERGVQAKGGRRLFFAAHFHQCGAQAAFEGAAGDERCVVVRVGGGAFDVEAVEDEVAALFALGDFAEAFVVFAGQCRADAADAVRGGAEGVGVVGEVLLDALDVAAFGDTEQFVALRGVEFGLRRVEGVEGVVGDDVVGGLVVFAGAEVEGRKRGEVQGVAVEEVCHGVFLL